MARWNARQWTKGAPRLRDLVTFDEEEFVMKAYAIAAETIKDQTMFDKYRKEVAATLVPFGGQFVVRGGTRRRMATSLIDGHRISFTRCRRRLVSISRISKSDLAEVEQFCRELDHRGRVGVSQASQITRLGKCAAAQL